MSTYRFEVEVSDVTEKVTIYESGIAMVSKYDWEAAAKAMDLGRMALIDSKGPKVLTGTLDGDTLQEIEREHFVPQDQLPPRNTVVKPYGDSKITFTSNPYGPNPLFAGEEEEKSTEDSIRESKKTLRETFKIG